ncbi:MAG TPA: hypothetical protein VKR31_13110, partial [Rhizomicrobium sp.]|nr:hypothetical protein [Rhizomicrobium sp.]
MHDLLRNGALLLCALVTAAPAVAQDALIPRQVLFGNPERTAAQVSPDGTRISFLAPRDGVMNVWVAPIGGIAKAKPVTAEKDRPIRQYLWSQDSRYILYVQDKGGTEDFLLYAADAGTGATRNLTPYEHTTVEIIGTSVTHPADMLIGLNNRDPKWHDIWRINVDTGKAALVYKNEGYSGFVADDDLHLRYATKDQPDGGFVVERFGADGAVHPFMTIPGDDALTTSVSGLDVAGTTLYGVDSRGRDKAALVSFDQKTAAPTVLAQSPEADIGGIFADPATGKVLAYSVEHLKTEWKALDPAVQPDIDFIAAHAKGQWSIESASRDGRYWIVMHDPVTEPAYYWLYDRRAKSLDKLFT